MSNSLSRGELERGGTLRGFADVEGESRRAENFAHDAAHGRGIVDDQDAARYPHPHRAFDQPPRLVRPRRLCRHRIGREQLDGGVWRREQHQERRLTLRARDRDHLRGRYIGDGAVDEDQIGPGGDSLTCRGDALAFDDLDGHPCRRGGLPEHVVVVLRRRQQNCPQRQQLVGHALAP